MPTESFFNFFSPPKPPTDDDDDNVPEDIEERLELDYQLGEDIKEKLIPHAIDWFTGEALQFEEIPDEVDQDEFGGDEDEDEEDDDDDDRRSDNAEEESDEEVRSHLPYLLSYLFSLTNILRTADPNQRKRLRNASKLEALFS